MGNRGDDFDIGIGMVLSFYFAMGFSPFFVSLMFSPSGLSSSSFFFFFLIIGILCAPIDFKISGKQGTLCFARGTQREFSAFHNYDYVEASSATHTKKEETVHK